MRRRKYQLPVDPAARLPSGGWILRQRPCISAEPAARPYPAQRASKDDYYRNAAIWAYKQGLVTGSILDGDQPGTCAEVVSYLWKLAGAPETQRYSFSDVPADADCAQAVAWAVQEGITSGTGEGKFSPDATCTRAQIVTFLYRAFGA